MSNLTDVEKQKIEDLFNMSSGYVLDFSDRTYSDFFLQNYEIGINDPKYLTQGTSKANRLRQFWEIESNLLVGKILEQMLCLWLNKQENNSIALKQNGYIEVNKIVMRLLDEKTMPLTTENNLRKDPYYSTRTGKNPFARKFKLEILRDMFKSFFIHFEKEGYFQEHLGHYCVDNGKVPGKLGGDLDTVFLLKLRKKNLTPIHDRIAHYSEDDLFDLIEFLYDHCSKPIEGTYHHYSDCGWHYCNFICELGQNKYRKEINMILCDYENGYELSNTGEILSLVEPGLEILYDALLPTSDLDNIESKVTIAQTKFRKHSSSLDDRRHAIQELVHVLEYLRPKLKEVLTSQDESDLFNIANNFGIRHHNTKQKINYDQTIWYSWMFNYYLATIHAVIRLINKKSNNK